jgi:hypothetical protein
MVLNLPDVSEETNDQPPPDDAVVTEACVEDKISVVKLGPAVSEVGIALSVDRVIEGRTTDVGCCDERA